MEFNITSFTLFYFTHLTENSVNNYNALFMDSLIIFAWIKSTIFVIYFLIR